MGQKGDADEGCGVAYSGEGESPDGASAVVAVAYHDEGQADGLVRIRVKGSRGVFGDVNLVADGSAVAAAVDGHRFVGERHDCGNERRNKALFDQATEKAMQQSLHPNFMVLKQLILDRALLENNLCDRG